MSHSLTLDLRNNNYYGGSSSSSSSSSSHTRNYLSLGVTVSKA